MGVRSAKLKKDLGETPAGTTIQVLDKKFWQLVETGHFDAPTPEEEEAEKKSVKSPVVADAAHEEE